MIKQYFKQAIYQLKENKLISGISIVGTALAICMIMVIVLVFEVRTADCVPEVNRSRSLYVKWMSMRQKGGNSDDSSNGSMSYRTAKECFKKLTTAEAVGITAMNEVVRASVPAGEKISADMLETDDTFWKVFSFEFIHGKPYTRADFEAGLPKTVITESVARKLYGTTDVVGKTVMLNFVEYTVTGVVKNISKLAVSSYAQIWIPFTSTNFAEMAWGDGLGGALRVIILAKSKDDFPAIRAEAEKLRLQYNDAQQNLEVFYRGQPDEHFTFINHKVANEEPDMKNVIMRYVSIIIILLLVPAINLSSMTLSRMRKRMSEIGVRKAFGATSNELLHQVFMENLILTLMAGVLGLVLSYACTFLLDDFLFSNTENMILKSYGQTALSADMLLNPSIFIAAFAFCLVLNVLSAGIPAWRASRMNITDALNQK